MAESGFIYALINPSMSGMVKVGRTARDPSGRADELSRATGVPTPFVLAYKRFFSDTVAAEQFVHTFLERKGYLVTANREFFRAPLEEVVEAILNAPASSTGEVEEPTQSDIAVSHEPDEFLDGLDVESHPLWETAFQEAEAHYLGLGSELQDYGEALRLYKQAAQLGSAEACLMVGKMYREGEGCPKSNVESLKYLKEGARRGEIFCYAEMAKMFDEEDQDSNALKCWERFFAASWDASLSRNRSQLGGYGYRYFTTCIRKKRTISHIQILRQVLPEMQDFAARYITFAQKKVNELGSDSNAPAILESMRQDKVELDRFFEENQ